MELSVTASINSISTPEHRSIMTLSGITKRSARKYQITNLIGCLSLACASVLSTAPSATALTFGEPATSNPFFYGGTSKISPPPDGDNWTFTETTNDIPSPIVYNSCLDENAAPCVNRMTTDDVTIYGGNNDNTTYTWTFTGTSGPPYLITFNGQFIKLSEENTAASAEFLINGVIAANIGASQTSFSYEIPTNQTFAFQIVNVDGFGDLEITNFNATPVPSPLPFAGLGLAALGIYRARRRKINT